MRRIVLNLPDDVANEAEQEARKAGLTVEAYLVRRIAEVVQRDTAAEAEFWNSINLSHLPDHALRSQIRTPISRKLWARAQELRTAQTERDLTEEEFFEMDRIRRTVNANSHLKIAAMEAWIERHGSLPDRTSEFWKVTPEEAATWAPF